MELSPSHTAPTVWGATVRKESHWKTKKSARVGLWKRRKAEKSKKRLSLLAWKSRKHRGIPTFPQPRLRLVINLNRTFHLLRKPDILICYQQSGVCRRSGPCRPRVGREHGEVRSGWQKARVRLVRMEKSEPIHTNLL